MLPIRWRFSSDVVEAELVLTFSQLATTAANLTASDHLATASSAWWSVTVIPDASFQDSRFLWHWNAGSDSQWEQDWANYCAGKSAWILWLLWSFHTLDGSHLLSDIIKQDSNFKKECMPSVPAVSTGSPHLTPTIEPKYMLLRNLLSEFCAIFRM